MTYLYSILCLLIIIFQGLLFFLIIYLPLSLWIDKPILFPAISAGIVLLIQLFFAPNIMDIFLVSASREEENSEESDSIKEQVEKILKNLDVDGVGINVFHDPIPVLVSMRGFFFKKKLSLSTGVKEALNPDEFETVITRETVFFNRPDTIFFTSASFMPFLLYSFSSWFIEAGRIGKTRGGSGAPHLAGAMVQWFCTASEYFLLTISRMRHGLADQSVCSKENYKETLDKSREKLGENFVKPVKIGFPFRKKVFEAMRFFLPFDPYRCARLKIWQIFCRREKLSSAFAEIDRTLSDCNRYYQSSLIFSTLPRQMKNVKRKKNEDNDDSTGNLQQFLRKVSKNTTTDYWADRLPLLLFLGGLPFIVFFRGTLGIPFVTISLGIALKLIYYMKKEKKTSSGEFINNSSVEVSGTLLGFKSGDEVEAPYFFVDSDQWTCPIILRQFFRNEDPLYNLQQEVVKVEGIFRAGSVPYIEIKSITLEKKDARQIRSANRIIYGILSAALAVIGFFFIVVAFIL